MNAIYHPWEQRGLGAPPYRLSGFWSQPSTSLAEQNPEAYRNALMDKPKGWETGICNVCGTALVNNYMLTSADGKRFVVGCECVQKSGDNQLISKIEKAEKLRVAKMRKAKREAKWQQQMEQRRAEIAKTEQEQRDRNGGKTDTELAESKRRDVTLRRYAILKEAIYNLEDGRGGFRDSVAADMREGRVPSGKGRSIALDILAKQAGRSGSKAYQTAHDHFSVAFDSAEGIK